MILARIRRARRISALAALLCASVAAVGAHDTGAAAERQIREQIVAHTDQLSVTRSVVADLAPRLGSEGRNAGGLVLPPPEALAPIAGEVRRRSVATLSVAPMAAPRPRRLAFKYEATAPPNAL